jgi:hypothetical protein
MRGDHRHRVVIGRTRVFCYMMETFGCWVVSVGMDGFVGPLPTPAVAMQALR